MCRLMVQLQPRFETQAELLCYVQTSRFNRLKGTTVKMVILRKTQYYVI